MATYGIKNRYLAELLAEGTSSKPIQSHWQGASRLANALLGGYLAGEEDKISAEERRLAQEAAARKFGLEERKFGLDERRLGLDERKLGLEHEGTAAMAGILAGQPPMSPRMTPEPQGPEGPHIPMTPPPGRMSLPPVQQATEGIVSAIPDTGPNAGVNIAPGMQADAARVPVAPQQPPPRQPQRPPSPQQAPLPVPIQQLLAHPNPYVQKRGIEEATKFRAKEQEQFDAEQKARVKGRVEAEESLPQAEATMTNALRTIETVRKHPGRDHLFATGFLAGVSDPPGNTQARDFKVAVDQLKGQSFLEAYSMLKGGGQIANQEGAKAEAAIARLDRAQTKEAFEAALNDYRDAIKRGFAALQTKAGVAPSRSEGGGVIQWERGPDGRPRRVQ